jgi:DNA-binding transcriptional LysR family regulator
VRRRGELRHGTAVRKALLEGLGIGLLPLAFSEERVAQRRLVPVLPRWRPPRRPRPLSLTPCTPSSSV